MWSLNKIKKKIRKRKKSQEKPLDRKEYQELLSKAHVMQDDINQSIMRKNTKIFYTSDNSGNSAQDQENTFNSNAPLTESNSPFLAEKNVNVYNKLNEKIETVNQGRESVIANKMSSKMHVAKLTNKENSEKNAQMELKNKYSNSFSGSEYSSRPAKNDSYWAPVNFDKRKPTESTAGSDKSNRSKESNIQAEEKKEIGRLLSNQNRSGFSWKTSLVTAALAIILVTLGWGLYYYWKRDDASSISKSVTNIADNIKKNVGFNSKSKSNLKYSIQKPNYLLLDTETINSRDISNRLVKISQEVSQEKYLSQLIEFIPVDKNNNPIAFSRFAYLFNLELDPSVINVLDEKFSLYVYNDKNIGHYSLMIEIKGNQKDELQKLLRNQEGKLAQQIKGLFVNQVIDFSQPISFKDSAYKSFKIRYTNLNNNTGSSIDYTVGEKYFIISTNKNIHRAILDKL